MFRTKLFTHLSRGVSGSAAINLRNVIEKNNIPLRSVFVLSLCTGAFYFADDENDENNKKNSKTTNVNHMSIKNDWQTNKKSLIGIKIPTAKDGERIKAEQRRKHSAHKKTIFVLEELEIELKDYEKDYARMVPSYASSR
jgi:hypothetical protein